jgi:hypothetical protein
VVLFVSLIDCELGHHLGESSKSKLTTTICPKTVPRRCDVEKESHGTGIAFQQILWPGIGDVNHVSEGNTDIEEMRKEVKPRQMVDVAARTI